MKRPSRYASLSFSVSLACLGIDGSFLRQTDIGLLVSTSSLKRRERDRGASKGEMNPQVDIG